MPLPPVLVTQYFQLIAKRALTEAEHELELIKLSGHSIISENEFENIRQILTKGELTETQQEINRLREVVASRRLSIVQREFESLRREFGSRQPAKIQQELEVIAKLLINKEFTAAEHEVIKLEQLLIDDNRSECIGLLKRFKGILAHRQFIEATTDLDLLENLTSGNQLAKAENELEKLKRRKQRTEWDKGYFRALYGIYLSRKSNTDNYTFFSKLDLSDKASLHSYRREFLEHTKNGLHGDFDRGYFSAWSDCMRVLAKLDIPGVSAPNAKEDEKEKPLETLRSDKSQATIANFFQAKEE